MIVRFLLFLVSLDLVMSNGIVEEPFVSCAPDAIYAKWKTEKTFGGRVNVRYAPNRFCYQVLVTNNQVELLIPHLDCRIGRIRSSSPPGLLLEATVLFSFHPEFVTEDDRLFVLRCLHTRNGSHMSAGNPLPLISESSEDVFEPPTTLPPSTNDLRCSYFVYHEENNERVNSVRIGSPVRHEWKCFGTREDQCLFVTNCFIKTVDSQHELVDEYGCTKDSSLIADLSYVDRNQVELHSRVFGVAEKPFVYYQCEMSLVDAEPNQICPKPKCSKNRRKRREVKTAPLFDLISQQIEVIPLGEKWPEISQCPNGTNFPTESTVCRNSGFCFSGVALMIGGAAISMILVGFSSAMTIWMLRRGIYRDVISHS